MLSVSETETEEENSVDEERANRFNALYFSWIINGSLKLLAEELNRFRYIGPLRRIPERSFQPDEYHSWSDGLSGWATLYKDYDPTNKSGGDFFQSVDKYLSDENSLNLGYSLRFISNLLLPEDSDVLTTIKLLKSQYEDKDDAFFNSRVVIPIQNLQTQKKIQLYDIVNQINVDPEDIGVGVSQVIPVVIGAMAPDTKVLAIEQPELHLHPAIQCRLGDLFIKEAVENDKIFIIETHSEHLILRMLRRIRETSEGELPSEAVSFTPEDLAVIYFESKESGMEVTELTVDKEGEFNERWPNGFFEERAEELF